MERTIDPDASIRWKKIGGGSFQLRKHIIKPGQVFMARPSEIPKNFRDVCIPLEEIKVAPPIPIEVKKTTYKIVPRGKSRSLYDVVDENGKVLNEKALIKDIAEKLVSDLEK